MAMALFELGGLKENGRLILVLAVAGFVAYFAAYSAAGLALIQGGQPLPVAMFLARCAGGAAMALAVWRTWTKNAPKGVTLVTPSGIEEETKQP